MTAPDPPVPGPADIVSPGAETPPLVAGVLETLRAGLRLLALRSLRDAELAEEAAQETVARTVAALRTGQVRDPARLSAFAHGIARHVIADLHRDRRPGAPLDGPDPPALPSPEPDSLHQLITDEENRRVRGALGRLSAADREILRLSFFEGLTPAEVAARTGEPPERIRKRKSRALERLRAAFGATPGGHDPPSAPTTP